jgi:hypothetical protein
MHHHTWMALPLLALIITGCAEKPKLKLKPVFPVNGSAFVGGKPAAGAVIVLHPLPLGGKTDIRSRGKVDENGKFVLTTYNTNDGVPEGVYSVTVFWPGKSARPLQDDELPPDQLEGRYSDPTNSKIKIHVKAPETTLEPFQLR